MAAPKVTSHRPGIQILLRHRLGRNEVQNLDITDCLGDTGAVIISKGLYSPAGEWSIQCPDIASEKIRPPSSRRDSLYGFCRPMDSIEIRMSRDEIPLRPLNPSPPAGTERMPVVIRGFVRSVGRDETVGGDGRPSRHVQLAGHDYGSAFIIQQLGALLALMQGRTISPLHAAVSIAGMLPKPMPANDFVRDAVKWTDDIMQNAGQQFELVMDEKPGWIELQTISSVEGPVWAFMTRYADLPWNELFVREGKDHPQLVYRKTPWISLAGSTLIDDPDLVAMIPTAKVHHVYRNEIIALRAHRDDSDTANYVWVQNALLQQNAGYLFANDPSTTFIATPATDPEVIGYRMVQLSSQQGVGLPSKDLPEADQERSYQSLYEWIKARIRSVGYATKENSDFESGTIQLHGRPEIQVGDFVRVHRGKVSWRAYITRVTHEFRPFHDYITTINFIRSDQYFVRNQFDGSPWDAERASEDPTP